MLGGGSIRPGCICANGNNCEESGIQHNATLSCTITLQRRIPDDHGGAYTDGNAGAHDGHAASGGSGHEIIGEGVLVTTVPLEAAFQPKSVVQPDAGLGFGAASAQNTNPFFASPHRS